MFTLLKERIKEKKKEKKVFSRIEMNIENTKHKTVGLLIAKRLTPYGRDHKEKQA